MSRFGKDLSIEQACLQISQGNQGATAVLERARVYCQMNADMYLYAQFIERLITRHIVGATLWILYKDRFQGNVETLIIHVL